MKQFTSALPLALLISMTPLSTYADNGAYGDIFVGSSSYELDVTLSGSGGSVGESFSRKDSYDLGDTTSYGLRVGYQFIDFIAIELGYSGFGEADNTLVDSIGDTVMQQFDLTAVTLGVKGILPLTNSFSLNARLGMASWDLSGEFQNASFPGKVENISEDGQDLFYGVGVEYSFDNSFYTGLEYSVTNFDWREPTVDDVAVEVEGEIGNIALFVGFRF